MLRQGESLIDLFCVIVHHGVVQRIHTVEQPTCIIGRREDIGIWLPDSRVSREHAMLRRSVGRATIVDLRSRNGTLVNGHLIREESPLNEGAEVHVGPFMLKICFSIAEATRQAVALEEITRSDSIRSAGSDPAAAARPALTPAQRRVYDGFMKGLSEKEIAAALKISIHTVHTHAKAIYKSFAICSRAELVSHSIMANRGPTSRLLDR